MTPYQAHRDARLIELDILDLKDLDPPADYRPLLGKLANRIGVLADRLRKLEEASAQCKLNSLRWEVLDDPTVTITFHAQGVHIFQDIPRGKKLLAQGKTLLDAVDRALGFR